MTVITYWLLPINEEWIWNFVNKFHWMWLSNSPLRKTSKYRRNHSSYSLSPLGTAVETWYRLVSIGKESNTEGVINLVMEQKLGWYETKYVKLVYLEQASIFYGFYQSCMFFPYIYDQFEVKKRATEGQ